MGHKKERKNRENNKYMSTMTGGCCEARGCELHCNTLFNHKAQQLPTIA